MSGAVLQHRNSAVYKGDEYVFVSDDVKYWVGRVCEIALLEVSGNYTKFTFENGQKLDVRGGLRGWEFKLPPAMFFRAHRGCLFNIGQVKAMGAYSRRQLFVVVGGNEIVMSNLQTALFRKLRSL